MPRCSRRSCGSSGLGKCRPRGRPRPVPAALETFVSALEASLDQAAAGAPNPGHVASHRMNRVEYVNAVRDLLDLEIDGATLSPSDLGNGGIAVGRALTSVDARPIETSQPRSQPSHRMTRHSGRSSPNSRTSPVCQPW